MPWNEDLLTNDQTATAVQGIVGDDDVDSLDYTVWRSHFGLGATSADANENGQVDMADYTIWQNHLGHSPSTAATSVPEPATWMLEVVALMWHRAIRIRQ